MPGYLEYRIQLKDAATLESIITAGGVCYVAGADDPAKVTLYSDKIGTSLANPIALTRGFINFFTADTVASVDLFIEAPGGQSLVAKGITPSGPNELLVDTLSRHQVMVIPFAIADTAANTETDTGFDTGVDKVFQPFPFVRVTTLDDTETIDVGTDGSGADDPNGFMAAVPVATAVINLPTLDDTVETLGVLLKETDSANAGDFVPEPFVNSVDEDITYTLSAGTDTAEGYIHLPYLLAA